MTTQTTHTLAVLKLPTAVAKLIALAKAIIAAMTLAKTTFPSPTPPLATVSTDVDALDTAETAKASKTAGTAQIRDAKKQVVLGDLHQLLAYVQQVADQNPTNAEAIIVSAGMSVRKKGAVAKPPLTVKAGVSGTVKLVAKSAKNSRSHEWQVSTDGKTWTSVPPTTKANAVVTGLASGVLTYFRHRNVTTAGVGDWTSPVSIAVS